MTRIRLPHLHRELFKLKRWFAPTFAPRSGDMRKPMTRTAGSGGILQQGNEPYHTATRPEGRTVLRWVQEEMKLKTIFVVDSKRIDRQRQLTTNAARLQQLPLAWKPQSSPRPQVPSGLC